MDIRTEKSSCETHRSIAIIILLCLLSILAQYSYGYALCRENEDGVKIFYKLASSSRSLLVSNDDNNHTYYSGEVKIPESIKVENYEYQVVGIANDAFKGSVSLTSVIMNSQIESIGDNAFDGCHSLNKVIFSPTVNTFGKFCFKDCPSLSFLDFSQCSALTRFSDHQFEGAIGLERIMFPPNLEHIGAQAFSECVSLKEFDCPSTVKSIGSGIFIGCSELGRIDLSNSNITSIPDCAFQQISNLTEIVLPKNLNSLGELCFFGSDKVSVVVPASVTSIGDICFWSCKKVFFVHSNFKIHHALGTGNYYFLDPEPPTFVNYDSNYDSERNVNIYVADKRKWSFFTNKDALNEIFSLPSETFTYDGLTHICAINEGIDNIKLTNTSNEAKSVGNYNWKVDYTFADKHNEYAYNFNYNFEIQAASLNVSVKDCSREYGDPNPRFEFVYSGFKNGDDESAISTLPTVTCSAKTTSSVGYYDIEVSGGESTNYNLSYTPGILTVEKAPLIIRAKNITKQFGQPNPNFDLLYFGFKNDDDENILIRLPKANTTATTESPVGEYSITPSDAAAQNYTIEYEPGVLTITKNILTAKVKDSVREYGTDNPQFVVEYSGFLNDDNEGVITQKPQFRTDAKLTSNVGNYEVLAYGASSPNYDFQYEVGHISITPKQISAKVGNYSRKYGEENPIFEVEYVGLVNDDNSTAITEQSLISCIANANSNVGDYPITLDGGRGPNYMVTSFTNGVLTIEKANQSIAWNQDLGNVQRYDQIELTAFASSGLPITYEVGSNNVIALYTSGNKTFIDCYGAGTVTIRATQKGNENYLASETVTNRITVVSEGGYIDPTNPDITINVTSAGTLSSKIAASKKYQIRSLTVSGPLNGTDIRYLREMAGRDVNGNKTTGILEKLDLSRATIVSGGDYYYTTGSYTSNRKYASNNVIPDYMFFGCSTLINLSLPDNSTSIGAYSFDGCINLSQMSMPSSVTSIGNYAFNGDISLTRISIPEQTTNIGNYAFQNCSGLNTLILSRSVRNIGCGILNGCPNIHEISLNGNNEYFSTCDGVLYDKFGESLIIYPAGKELQTFEIPDGVKEIKNSGFFGVKTLKYLFIPESLMAVGIDAFKGCSNLTKLYARPSTPPECLNECFDEVSKSNCTLYVPRWSGSAYWVAPVWADFVNIEAVNDLSVGGNVAKPDYCFEFTETTLSRGKQTYIPVSMNNVDPIVAFNFDIVLPEGIDIYKDTSGSIQFKPTDRVPMSQVFTAVKLTNGNIRVICNSTSNEPFEGTEGILFYLPLFLTDANADIDSEYVLTLKDIEFSKKTQSGYYPVNTSDLSTTLTVGQFTMGDANCDGRITSLDAAMTRDYFLERNPIGFILKAADMNNDGKISGIDVVLVTDEFLAQNKATSAKSRAIENNGSQLLIKKINSDHLNVNHRYTITLPNAGRFTSVAMDIILPDGMNISDLRVSEENSSSHVLRYYQHPDGFTRIIVYSDLNEKLVSDNILTFEITETVSIHISEMITIDEIQAVEIIDGDYNELSIIGVNTNLSDISVINDIFIENNIEIWSENASLFIKSPNNRVITLSDMSGRSRILEINEGVTSISLIPGIYIVDNKKILIK